VSLQLERRSHASHTRTRHARELGDYLTWFVGRTDVDRLFADSHVALTECINAVEASFREHGNF